MEIKWKCINLPAFYLIKGHAMAEIVRINEGRYVHLPLKFALHAFKKTVFLLMLGSFPPPRTRIELIRFYNDL